MQKDEKKKGFMKELTVLGGGISGLAHAYYAERRGISYAVIDAGDSVGGMVRTKVIGDFSYDTGAHRLHDSGDDIVSEYRSILKDEMQEVNVQSMIYEDGSLLVFPFTPFVLLRHIGLGNFLKAGIGVVAFRLFASKNDFSFKTFAYRKYGKMIADRYLCNYSRKLWGIPCEQLLPTVGGKRLAGINLRTILKDIISRSRGERRHMEGKFYYPKGGIGKLTDSLQAACCCGSIHINSTITRIYHDHSRITAVEINKRQRVAVNRVVSTLPLSVLVELLDPAPPRMICDAAKKLCYRDTRLVIIMLNRQSVTNAATIYFPSEQYLFTRVYEPRNRCKTMAPANKTSLVAEVPCSRGDKLSQMEDKMLSEMVVEQLEKANFIRKQEVLSCVVDRLEYSYPVLDIKHEDATQRILTHCDLFSNLMVAGRSGTFRYLWIHDMMSEGRANIEAINRNRKQP